MSETVSGAGDTDTFAAEFVLGTLDPDERRAAHQLLANDEGFAARVKLWERRLGELHVMVEPVEPASDIWPRIKAGMPHVEQLADIEEAEPEPEPEAEPEPEPEPHPESAPEPEPESEPEPDWQAEPQPELQADAGLELPAEPEPEIEQPCEEPARPVALEKPIEKEPPPKFETPPPPPQPAPPPPSWHLPPEQTEEPRPAPAPPFVAPPAPKEIEQKTEQETKQEVESVQPRVLPRIQRSLTRWRVLAALMLVALVTLAGLVAAWRFIPERVPAPLQPVALMRLAGIPVPASAPARKPPPPPESSFEE
jgi:anti-sigma-K factor RskA